MTGMRECLASYRRISTRNEVVEPWGRPPATVARRPDGVAPVRYTVGAKRPDWWRRWVISRSTLRDRRARVRDFLLDDLLDRVAGRVRPGCATLLLFLLSGFSRHFFLFSRLLIVEFRHELSVPQEVGFGAAAMLESCRRPEGKTTGNEAVEGWARAFIHRKEQAERIICRRARRGILLQPAPEEAL